MGVYGDFESCESVIVVCEYKGNIVDVYGINNWKMSMVREGRKRN